MKIFFTLLLLGADAAVASANVNLDSLISAIGKSQKHKLIRNPQTPIHPTEDSLYQTLSWKDYQFKSTIPLKGTGKDQFYFVYDVSILTFKDTLKAAYRLKNVNQYYTLEDKYMKKLQYRLRVGKDVVFLSTHPVIYETPLKALYKVYQEKLGEAGPK